METTEQLSSVKSVAASLPTLRVLFTGEQGIVIRPPLILEEGRTQLGRSVEPPGISLPHDKRASRAHAAVYLEQGVLTIADEESRNGTFVNGQRIEPGRSPGARSPLRDGDVVRIGDSFVLVRQEPTDTADAPSAGPLGGLIGRAPAMRRLRSYIKLVAPTPATVTALRDEVDRLAAARAEEAGNGQVIKYSIPKEGSLLWFDMMAIPADAKEPKAAQTFINYILRPEVHASLTNKVFYANPNLASKAFVQKNVAENPTVFLSGADLGKLTAPDSVPQDIRRVQTRRQPRRLLIGADGRQRSDGGRRQAGSGVRLARPDQRVLREDLRLAHRQRYR